ncbi:hypothetical protein Tco_0493188 [Tanacetum coccineum]
MFHHSNECKDVVTLLSKAGMKPSEITKIVYAFEGGEEDQLTRVQCSAIVSEERKCNLGKECHGIIMHFKENAELDKVITSLDRIGSHMSPTKSLFDVGSSRISIYTVNTKYHSDVAGNHKDNA